MLQETKYSRGSAACDMLGRHYISPGCGRGCHRQTQAPAADSHHPALCALTGLAVFGFHPTDFNEPAIIVCLPLGTQLQTDVVLRRRHRRAAPGAVHGQDSGHLQRGFRQVQETPRRPPGVHSRLCDGAEREDVGEHLPVRCRCPRFLPRRHYRYHIQQPDRGARRETGHRRDHHEHLHPQVPTPRGRGPHHRHLRPGGGRHADRQGREDSSQAHRPPNFPD